LEIAWGDCVAAVFYQVKFTANHFPVEYWWVMMALL
jgi:hypothetical protein